MPSQIVPTDSRHDFYYTRPGEPPVRFQIVGFSVDDKNRPTPICYPAPPPGSGTFIRDLSGFRRFDLATGLIGGPPTADPSFAEKQ